MTPGKTICLVCGFHDFLVLPLENVQPCLCMVRMDCQGCEKRTSHTFEPV
jgi:hypothetical protein